MHQILLSRRSSVSASELLARSLRISPDQPQVERTPLQSSEWPVGYNATTMTVTFKPNGFLPRHAHPGVEMGYVLEGEVLLKVDGKADLKVKQGDSWIVPANTPHSVTGGATGAKVLGTYVVDKTKPLASPAP